MRQSEPVSIAELTTQTQISAFDAWVSEICSRYTSNPMWLRYFDEKRGLSKDIQEELIPLALLTKRISEMYGGSFIKYYQGDKQSFDAQIFDTDGNVIEILEITLACNGYQETLARESLVRHGYSPLYSDIPKKGSRALRELPPPELVSLDADAIVVECINLIHSAVIKKSNSGKYQGISLLVAFDDFRLLTSEHFELVKAQLISFKTCFSVVYYVGLCGRFFLRVPSKA